MSSAAAEAAELLQERLALGLGGRLGVEEPAGEEVRREREELRRARAKNRRHRKSRGTSRSSSRLRNHELRWNCGGSPPSRGHDALTLLVEFPQPELSPGVHRRPRSLLALELVNKSLRDILRSPAHNGAWAAEMPRQIDQRLGQAVNCIGKPNVNKSVPCTLAARGRYLRSRHATLRLRDLIDAKSRYNVETDRYGEVETVEDHRMAHPSLKTWWADARTPSCGRGRRSARQRPDAAALGRCSATSRWCELKAGWSPSIQHPECPTDLALADSRIEDMLFEYVTGTTSSAASTLPGARAI